MSTTTIRPAPVRKSIVVKADAAHAFEVFTARISNWWPRSHSVGASPQTSVVMEPRSGGRWYEIGQDGSQCNWGKVLAFEPPSRLLLAWQISGDWKYDPDLVTEVEVKFTSLGGGETRVELEHRNIDRHGEGWGWMREAVDSEGGWPLYLRRFAELFEA